VGIANIYAPNNPQDRITLWTELAQSLPVGPRWILAGGLNMMLDSKDRSNPLGRLASDSEKFAFQQLTDTLQVEDFFDHNNTLLFPWDNKR
jgi:hypothetical protein